MAVVAVALPMVPVVLVDPVEVPVPGLVVLVVLVLVPGDVLVVELVELVVPVVEEPGFVVGVELATHGVVFIVPPVPEGETPPVVEPGEVVVVLGEPVVVLGEPIVVLGDVVVVPLWLGVVVVVCEGVVVVDCDGVVVLGVLWVAEGLPGVTLGLPCVALGLPDVVAPPGAVAVPLPVVWAAATPIANASVSPANNILRMRIAPLNFR